MHSLHNLMDGYGWYAVGRSAFTELQVGSDRLFFFFAAKTIKNFANTMFHGQLFGCSSLSTDFVACCTTPLCIGHADSCKTVPEVDSAAAEDFQHLMQNLHLDQEFDRQQVILPAPSYTIR